MTEKLLYDEKIEQEVFKEILDALTFIKPDFISREKYRKLNWNILVETKNKDTQENKKSINRKDYILSLPNDITELEFPSIILRINKLTFWEKLPEYSSTKELQIKILIAYKNLFAKYKKIEKSKNQKKIKKYQKTIWRYSKVYSSLWFDIKDLESTESVESIIEKYSNKKLSTYEKNRIKRNAELKLIEFKDEIETDDNDYDKYLKDELSQHFEETFFERWVNNIRFGLKLMKIINFIEVKKRKNLKIKWEKIDLHWFSVKEMMNNRELDKIQLQNDAKLEQEALKHAMQNKDKQQEPQQEPMDCGTLHCNFHFMFAGQSNTFNLASANKNQADFTEKQPFFLQLKTDKRPPRFLSWALKYFSKSE